MKSRLRGRSSSINRFLSACVLALIVGCGAWRGGGAAYPSGKELEAGADEIDFSGIQRDGAKTDVIAEYWARSFSSVGDEDTFELFRRKYELLTKEDPEEAQQALRGFRRLCKLRGDLDPFDRFWARAK